MAVEFRFQFQEHIPNELPRLLSNYIDKWRILVRYLFSIHRDKATYARLLRIRSVLPRGFTLDSVIDRVIDIDDKAARMLMDANILFDRVPYDFQTFILAVLGVDYPEIQDDRNIRTSLSEDTDKSETIQKNALDS